jgi:hypothetical protein
MPRPRLTVTSVLLAAAVLASACKNPLDEKADAGAAAALGTVDTDPTRLPPPLRQPHPAVPALPDLPALANHDDPGQKPGAITLSLGKCKGVWDGTQISATGCGGVLRLLSKDDAGAHSLVSRKVLPPPTIGMPAVVDHRAEGTEGVVRNQGQSPACTAFAASAAIDHAIARWLGKAAHVSVMEFWSRYHSPYEGTAISSNLGFALGVEEDWPFDARIANMLMPCSGGEKPGTCGYSPDPKKVALVGQRQAVLFTRAHNLPDTKAQTLQLALASGADVVVTMSLPEAFVPKGKPGSRYIPNYTQTPADSGHAMLVSGYANFKDGAYFLLHNSWGTSWGDGGYAWIHQATLAAHIDEAMVIDAEPLVFDGALKPKRQRGEVSCAGALVPDSIRGTCAPLCPDGSPRHDGVCPAPKSPCPVGYVNLIGACERAAPVAKGTDSDNGVVFQCGPGGCTYQVPRALDATCTGDVCKASCPAPDFRLAKDKNGLTCVQ